MDKFEEYESLLSEENIAAVRERREAIARAIDTLVAQMDEFNAERRKLDEKDQHVYVLARKLDEAYARINRGVRYTTQAKKRLVQRSWEDETHLWVEQYLLHWVRKLLQEGPKTVGTMSWDKPGRFAIADAIRLMEQHPEEFTYAKGPKPQRKYARADYVWSLKANPSRPLPPVPPPFWNIEADFTSRDQRPRSFSESLHEMLEQAIQMFYSKQASSAFAAFADLYFRDFARAYHSLRQAYDYIKIEADVAKKMAADQAGSQTDQKDKTEDVG